MKKHPIFISIIAVCVLVLIVTGVFAFMASARVETASDKLDRAASRLAAAKLREPAPSEANLTAAQNELDELLAALETQIEIAAGRVERLQMDPPTNGNQMFFELEGYAAELSTLARNVLPIYAEVDPANPQTMDLPDNFEDYAFGFQRYLGNGTPPDDELVPIVNLQKEVLNYLLRELFDVRPLGLVRVQRENARAVLERRSGVTSPERRQRQPFADEFVIGGQSLRVPNVVETLAFAVTFRGYTQNLRPYLRTLESSELPIVVRSVTVTPLESSMVTAQGNEDEDEDDGGATDPFAALLNAPQNQNQTTTAEPERVDQRREPVVTQNEAEFTVMVEFVELLIEPNSEPLAGADSGDLEGEDA